MLFGYLVNGNRQLAIGKWQMAIDNWQMAIGNCYFALSICILAAVNQQEKDHMQKAYFVLIAWSVSIVFSFLKDWSV